MEYAEIFRLILRRWWLILLPLLLSAVIVVPELVSGSNASGGFAAEIRYSAAQRFNLPERDGDYTDVWLASEHTVDALTDWSRSSSFREEMRAALVDSNVSMDSLVIAADNARNVGVIYFSHRDQAALAAITDAAVLILSNRSQTYFPQLGGEAAQVTILDQPIITSTPASLSTRLAPLIRLGLALFVGLALALVAEYIDQTIYHPDELRRLGIPIVGQIPSHRS